MKWKNEREWRFIKTDEFNYADEFNHGEAIPKSVERCICAVYFGSNMDENLKHEIELYLSEYELNSKYRRHINFYDIEPIITMKKRAEIINGDPNF